MQMRQLTYFVAVCETLNFTKAAKRFYISQTAVTQQIKALETELGVQLFNRDNRHVTITPAGVSFLTDARRILAQVASAKERVQAANTAVLGTLRIGYVNGLEKTRLADWLNQFHQQYPNATFTLLRQNVAALYDAVLADQLDLVLNLNYTSQPIPHLKTKLLQHAALMAVFPMQHPLANQTMIRPAALKDYPLIDIEKHTSKYHEATTIMKFFTDAGFLPDVKYVSNDIENTILAVAAGLGYALLPAYFTQSLNLDDRVIALPIVGCEKALNIVAAWKPENTNPLLPYFLSLL